MLLGLHLWFLLHDVTSSGWLLIFLKAGLVVNFFESRGWLLLTFTAQ
jgi:hypothetical protein